ncbi:MAG: glyceraldehyde 3-phosphate dehydrogenase NAD-binding domain-containing protein [Candidatus Lernaella stagnicola]|nr:glyceraldehyde 3-phosphate dehydrogenase NAD-binding domain-containing protein [Candidatus Lernaella stagnicola]
MAIRVALNGFGRTGRAILREAKRRKVPFNFTLINDLADPALLVANLRFDSVHGAYPKKQVKITKDDKGHHVLVFGTDHIRILGERDNAKLPLKEMGVDVVIDTTGAFPTQKQLAAHFKAGAKKVLIYPPPKAYDPDYSVIMGVNEDGLTGREKVISAGSCTSNAAGPLVKLLDEHFGIETLYLSTVHAYTSDQRLLDYPHEDVRRGRAAGLSIIPTSTNAGTAIERILPHLKGRVFTGAHRVPVPDGSIVDLTFQTGKPTTVEAINKVFEKAARSRALRNVLEYTTDPLVSVDVVGSPYSAIFDSALTQAVDESLLKVAAWFDNEIGYANRVIDVLLKLDGLGKNVWS